MADVTKTVSILFRAEDQTSDALRGINKAIDGIGDGAGKIGETGRQIDKLGDSAGTTRGLLAELGGVVSVGLLAKAFIDANSAAEIFQRQMLAVTGSTAGAANAVQYVGEVANRLGISVGAASQAFASFSAATKGTSIEGENTRLVFEAFAGAISRFGGSAADVQGAFTQLAQGIGRGKFELEDLKSVAERIPGGFNTFSKALGISTAAIFDMVSAGKFGTEQILKIAESLADTSSVEGYSASLNRLQNAFDLLLVRIGDTGIFAALADATQKGAQATGVFGVAISSLADKWEQTKRLFTRGELDLFTGGLSSSEKAALEFVRSLQGPVNETLAETARLLRQNGDAAKNAYPDQTANETKRLADAANTLTDQLKREAEALKILKVNRDEVNRSTKDYANLIETLGKSKSVTDSEFLQAVANAAKNIRAGTNDVILFKDALSDAGVVGARNGDTIAKAFKLVDDAAKNAVKGTDKQAEALKKQAEEAKKAEEAQERLRLELEKLASNERIKLIEARVQLNVAEVQEQTKRIQAAFESLDNTVNSTADVINKAFGVLGDQTSKPWIDTDLRNKLFEQIDRENTFRERALKTQEELTQAQVDLLRQQARQIERGDALIKVDGSGLAPHLEAFMWEILKAVQVRTNRDGLKLLLGVT